MEGIERFSELIKKIAIKAVESKSPTAMVFGTVISIDPLQVKISNELILTKEFLIVPKSLSNYEITIQMNSETDMVGTNTEHTHVVNSTTSEKGSFNNTHKHTIKGTQTISINNALKINDKVILARVQGGQSYIILDKVG